MEQWFIDAKWSGEGKVTITAKPWVPTLNFNMYRSGRVKKFMNISRTFPSDKLKSWFLVKVSLTGQEKKKLSAMTKSWKSFLLFIFHSPTHPKAGRRRKRDSTSEKFRAFTINLFEYSKAISSFSSSSFFGEDLI